MLFVAKCVMAIAAGVATFSICAWLKIPEVYCWYASGIVLGRGTSMGDG